MANIRIDYFDRVTALFSLAYGANDAEKLAKLEELLKDPNFILLLNYGYNSQGNHSAIFFACYGGASVDAVSALLKAGANPFQRDNIGRIPLHLASNSADPAIVAEFLAVPNMGLFIDDAAKDTGQTPFHTLFLPGSGNGPAAKSKNADLAACLTKLLKVSPDPVASLNKKDSKQLTPLILAKHYGLLAAFDGLELGLKAKLNLDGIVVPANIEELLRIDFYGRTEFLEAAFVNNKTLVKKAIAEGADTMVFNKQSGRNAVELACCGQSDGETVTMLLDAPSTKLIDVSGKPHATHQGRTFWHYAANTGRIDTNTAIASHSSVISQLKLFINALDNLNRTPLHAAAMAASRTTLTKAEKEAGETLAEREKVIDLLFASGVAPSVIDANGQTALDIAVERKNTVVAERIRFNILKMTPQMHAFDAMKALRSLPPPKLGVFDTERGKATLAALAAAEAPGADKLKAGI